MNRLRRSMPVITVLAGTAALLVSCSTGTSALRTSAAPSTTAGGSSTTPGPSASSTPAPPPSTEVAATKPVHIQLKFSDGQTFGVGIPVIAFFSKHLTDATALQNATTVRINGKPVTGGRWYFESVVGHPGYPIEGDYRLKSPWPAHSHVFVSIPAKGLSAGPGMAFDDSLTSSFSTGASHIAIVDNSTHQLTLYVDSKVEGRYPVSLGATNTPTAHGIKVIMEKGRSICMTGPGYHDCGVKYTQRLTYGGEYLHSAPWNCLGSPGCIGPANNIGHADSSNGCTNLLPDDAAKLYSILRIGDIVRYPDANGPAMTMGAGYGDWNVKWSQWLQGGDIRTS